MKIYFSGSIRGGRDDTKLYSDILNLLPKYGEVISNHVGDVKISAMGENVPTDKIYARNLAWLKDTDVLVAEVTAPSLGVGYEIAKADELGKKIICLYREIKGKSISAMISGNKRLNLTKYATIEDIKSILDKFLL